MLQIDETRLRAMGTALQVLQEALLELREHLVAHEGTGDLRADMLSWVSDLYARVDLIMGLTEGKN